MSIFADWPTARVFVDDSNPSIVYSGKGAWVAQTGIDTSPQPWNLPDRAPLYGTQHEVRAAGSLSYVFNGVSVSALFSLVASDQAFGNILSCEIDGKEAGIHFDEMNIGTVTCAFNNTILEAGVLEAGEHNVTISIRPHLDGSDGIIAPPSFDGLFYTPSEKGQLLGDIDVAYTSIHNMTGLLNVTSAEIDILSVPGDMIDFMFNGTSMSLYVTYEGGDNVPVGLSYKVDDGPTMNFTVNNPSSSFSATDQLVIQTPQYEQGQHRFHLDFLGPSDKQQILQLDHIIVQNDPDTRRLVESQAFPTSTPITITVNNTAQSPATTTHSSQSPPTGGTQQATPNSHRIGHATIIGIAVAIVAVLAILTSSFLYIRWRLRRRKASTRHDGSGATVSPFITTAFTRTIIPPSSKRLPNPTPELAGAIEHTSKQSRPLQLGHTATQDEPTPAPAPASAYPAPDAMPTVQGPAEDPIYRIHEDGGSVHEPSSATPGQRRVIDLPPTYSFNFARHQEPEPEDSNAGVHEPNIV
ncbi:hypothetical protein CPC08DRAFT_716613 [Agrocybe pediades]|nr:hypothetical protein CPC08DRAFT_716613 [Agrocybe pediades]